MHSSSLSTLHTGVLHALQPGADSSGPNVLGWVGVIGGLIGGAAGVAAVVVAVHFNRRSSKAADDAADSSRESADAAKRSADVAERDERQRAADRHEAEGPDFEPEGQSALRKQAEVKLRVSGGPRPMRLRIFCEDVPWAEGVSKRGQQAWNWVEKDSVYPDQLVHVTVHLSDETLGFAERTLPLRIEVQSVDDPEREWIRPVSVRLKRPPRVYSA